MPAPLTRGTVYYYDGTEANIAIGTHERLRAERQFTRSARLEKPEEYLAFLAFAALQREGLSNIGFEKWAETVAGIEFDDEADETILASLALLHAIATVSPIDFPPNVLAAADALRACMKENYPNALAASESDAEGESPTPHS